MVQVLPQRAELGKLLRLQDEVARRTVVIPEDYLSRQHTEDVERNARVIAVRIPEATEDGKLVSR